MIKSDAKSLHSFPLKDFSGGVNTDTPGTDKELLQCINAVLDPKGFPELRGGSKILNVDAPIGYQEKEVWGYLLSCDSDSHEYTDDFLNDGSISASSIFNAAHNADKAVDNLDTTYWQMMFDLLPSATTKTGSGGVTNHLLDLAVDGNDATYFQQKAYQTAYPNGDWATRNIAGLDLVNPPNYIGCVIKNGCLLSTDTVTISAGTGPTWLNGTLYSAGGYISGGYVWYNFVPDVATNAWVKFNLGTGIKKIFTAITMGCGHGSDAPIYYHAIKDYEIYGSNNDSTWVLLSAAQFPNNTWFWQAEFVNDVAYQYYKVVFLNIWTNTHSITKIKCEYLQLYDHRPWLDFNYVATTKAINKIEMFTVANNFKDFIVYASTDQNTWVQLYEGVSLAVGGWQTFKFINNTSYRYYRIRFTSDWSTVFGTPEVRVYTIMGSDTPASNEWLKYDLGSGVTKTARKMTITPYNSGVRLFTLYGSNDDTTYTSIYSSTCESGTVKQEFEFANATAYRFYKLAINTVYGDYHIAVQEWELMELSTSADLNYYIFNKTAKDIIRKVNFPTLSSMINFVTYWKARTSDWATTYYCTPSDFDIDDNSDVSTKVIAEGEFTIANFSEAILDSKINEWVSIFSLLMEEINNEMFGSPQAWRVTLGGGGVTSMHELKRRDLKKTYTYDSVTGIFSGATISPEQYVQNKFVFVTADNALLVANVDNDLDIHGFNVLATGLKVGAVPSWINFQNRAFMANGDEDDADLKWTDGEVVHRVGLVAPETAPTLSANAATGGHMTDGVYYYKYAYHRTTYGTNDSNPSPELEVTLSGGLGSIDSSSYFGGTGYSVGQILAVVYAGASGATFKIETVDGAGKVISLAQLTGGVKYVIANGLATTVDVAGGTGATVSVLSIIDLDKTQMTTLVVNPSSDPQVDKIYLYRTKFEDYIFYKCAEIDNVYDANHAELTLTIDSTENDNSLGVSNLLDIDNDLPLNSKYLENGGDRMWYIINSGVYFSKKGFPEKVPIENWISVNEDDGEKVMGAKIVGTWLVIGKETRMFAIDINNPSNFQAICIADTIGLVDNKTFRAISDQALIWYSQLGFCWTDGMSVLIVSKGKENTDGVVIGKIFNDLIDNFDSARKSETFGIYYPKRQQYWCHVPYVGLDVNGLPNYRIWVLDLQKRGFFKFQFPIEPKDFFLLTDSENNQKLISTFTQVETAKYYGYFVIYDDDTDYHDVSSITLAGTEGRQDIAMQVITCWNSLGLPERIKSFRSIYTELYAAAAMSFYISCGIDYKRMECVQIPLNGSINTTASVNVVGVGTYFLTELVVGDSLVVGTETRVVATITDNTHLTVTLAFSDMANDVSIFKLAPGIHRVQIVHAGEVGSAPTAGRDEIEGYDYGRTRAIPSPVDGVGTYFSIRFEYTGHVKIKLFGFTIMFRLRGARP